VRRWLRHLPNVISSIRILLIVPLSLALLHHDYVATLWLFVIAGGSDAIDGYLARQFGWASELGGMLDPIADKLMLATVFVLLAAQRALPAWLAAAVIARDLIIVAGAVSYRLFVGTVAARPSVVSKLNTLIQILFILALLARLQFGWPLPWVTLTLGAAVLSIVVVSGLDYVLVYGRLATAARQSVPAAARRSTPA
jgi:cardiolipin synthase